VVSKRHRKRCLSGTASKRHRKRRLGWFNGRTGRAGTPSYAGIASDASGGSDCS